jgi:predicted nucleic acid-binding protein
VPTKSSGVDIVVDTSVAVSLIVESHEHHDATLEAVDGRRLALAGHAAFETFSVLTRLPPPLRRSPEAVVQLLNANFPFTAHLSPTTANALLTKIASRGIAGGSIYDAMVGISAVEYDLVLLTRDLRALPVYRSLGVELEVIRDH